MTTNNFNTRGSGGSGGRSTFTPSESPFVSLATRNTWASANLDMLFNSTSTVTEVVVNNELYRWSGDDGPASYNSNLWLQITDVLDGSEIKTLYEANADTNAFSNTDNLAVDSVKSLTVGNFPIATASGMEDSALEQMPDGTLQTVGSLRVGTNSIDLDFAHRLSSSGENITASNLQTGVDFHPVWQTYELGRNGATMRHRYAELTLPINTDDTGTMTNPSWSVTVPQVASEGGQTATWADAVIDSSSVLTNVELELQIGGVVFTRFMNVLLTPDNVTGVYRFEFKPNFDFTVGSVLTFTLSSADGDVVLKSNAAETIPTISQNVILWDDKPLAILDDVIGLDLQNSVISEGLSINPTSPSVGDRYIIGSTGANLWTSHGLDIAEWDGADWQFTTPSEPTIIWNETLNKFNIFRGGSWTVYSDFKDAERDKLNTTTPVILPIQQGGHGFIVGDVLYRYSSGYAKAQANNLFKAQAIGIVSNVVNSGNFELTISGYINTLSGLTAGSHYYLHTTVAGEFTTSISTGEGHYLKPILTALSATEAIIHDNGAVPNLNAYVDATISGQDLTLTKRDASTTVITLPGSGGSGVARNGVTEQYELTQFDGDTNEVSGSGIVLVDYEGGKVIPESAIQGYVEPPTNIVGITGGINLNTGTNFDLYKNKIMVYSGDDLINVDLPVYGGTDGSGAILGSTDTYDVGDVFALRNSGTVNIKLRVILTGGGTIQPIGTNFITIAPGGYAALVKASTNLQFELLSQAGQNSPGSQSNVLETRLEEQGGVGFSQTNSQTPVTALTLADMDLVSGRTYELIWTGQVNTTDASNEAVIQINKELIGQAPLVKTTVESRGFREPLANVSGPENIIFYYTATADEQVDFTVEVYSYDGLTTVTVSSNTLKIQRVL